MKERFPSNRGLRRGRASRLRGRLLVAFLLSSGFASAEEVTKQMCVDSHLKAQSQHLEGQLVDSLRSLRTCANQDCPDIVQRGRALGIIAILATQKPDAQKRRNGIPLLLASITASTALCRSFSLLSSGTFRPA